MMHLYLENRPHTLWSLEAKTSGQLFYPLNLKWLVCLMSTVDFQTKTRTFSAPSLMVQTRWVGIELFGVQDMQ